MKIRAGCTLNGRNPIQIANTITAELFPTELRASAGAVAHNLLGRLGMVVGPPLVGAAAAAVGSTGEAVALLSLANLALVPLALWLVPETRGVEIAQSAAETAEPSAGD